MILGQGGLFQRNRLELTVRICIVTRLTIQLILAIRAVCSQLVLALSWVGTGGFGAASGGTFFNVGVNTSATNFFNIFSISVTGTVEAGITSGVVPTGTVGISGFVTNASTVSQLLGASTTVSVGGESGRAGNAFTIFGEGVEGFGISRGIGPSLGPFSGNVSVTSGTTSAIGQLQSNASGFLISGGSCGN